MYVGLDEVVILLANLLRLQDCLHELLVRFHFVAFSEHYVDGLLEMLQFFEDQHVLSLQASMSRDAKQYQVDAYTVAKVLDDHAPPLLLEFDRGISAAVTRRVNQHTTSLFIVTMLRMIKV